MSLSRRTSRDAVDLEDREAFLELAAALAPWSRSQRLGDLFALWHADFADNGCFVELGEATEGRSELSVLAELGWRQMSAPALGDAGVVDSLSIDAAGHEMEMLTTIDLGRSMVRVISVAYRDENRREIREHLEARGYRRKWMRLSQPYDWYVRDDLIPQTSAETADQARQTMAAKMVRLPPNESGLERRHGVVRALLQESEPGSEHGIDVAQRPDSREEAAALAGYPEPRYRAAIVQFEAGHEECTPALVHLLRLHGVEPTVYLTERLREQRPGFRARFPEVAQSVRFIDVRDGKEWWRLQAQLRASGVDLIVINTFQHTAPANWAAAWDGPMLGVVHDPPELMESAACVTLAKEGRITLLTLAPHATSALIELEPALFGGSATITSAYPWVPRVRPERPTSRRLIVPGRVGNISRDYDQLLDVLPDILTGVGAARFEIDVVGGGPYRAELERLVAARGLQEHIIFAPLNEHGYVPQREYFARLRGATFILPLRRGDRASFRRWKITSAVPASLGLCLPLIIDRWTATAYDVPAVTYGPGEIGEAVVRAVTMSGAELERLRARLAARGAHEMERATQELGYALRRVGLRV